MKLIPWVVLAVTVCLMQTVGRQATKPSDTEPDGSSFVAVMIDEATEDALGPFPFDRAIYARGVNKLDELGASVIVLKMYLDEEKTTAGDTALAEALRNARAKVVLLAAPDEAGPLIQPPARFAVAKLDPSKLAGSVTTSRGWFPLPMFIEHADALGFDVIRRLDQAPLVLNVNGRLYRSGFLSILETTMGIHALIEPGKSVTLGPRSAMLTRDSELPLDLPKVIAIDYISFIDLINGATPEDRIKGKAVILGYLGRSAPITETPNGKVKSVVCYWQMLLATEKRLAGPHVPQK